MSLLQKFGEKRQPLNNERGLEIMEAGIYAVLVIVASILAMQGLGTTIAGAWTAIQGAV